MACSSRPNRSARRRPPGSFSAAICSLVMPCRLPEAACERVQYAHPFTMDVRRYASSLSLSDSAPSTMTPPDSCRNARRTSGLWASQVAQKLAVQLVCASAAREALAIDEERRRTVYVAVRATLKILVNAFEIRVVSHVLAEALRVESDLARVLPQVQVVQRLLVLEQYVVHCPEVVLA